MTPSVAPAARSSPSGDWQRRARLSLIRFALLDRKQAEDVAILDIRQAEASSGRKHSGRLLSLVAFNIAGEEGNRARPVLVAIAPS